MVPSMAQKTLGRRMHSWSVRKLLNTMLEELYTDLEARVYKPSSTARNSTTTPADDPHLVLALTAGVWAIEARFRAESASATPDLKYNFAYGGTINAGNYSVRVVDESSNLEGDAYSSWTSVDTWALAANVGKEFVFHGFIDVDDDEDFSLQWSQDTSNASTVTVAVGAYILARKLA